MPQQKTNDTNNPLAHYTSTSLPVVQVSTQTHHIAGILTTIYGLAELSPSANSLAVLWLLHPRLQTQACMQPLAANTILTWNQRAPSKTQGLIAVSFDQRNHGSRLVDKVANESWRGGNNRHAIDMFGIYHGTQQDMSLLLTYLPAYLPQSAPKIGRNIALGISLGGHAAYLAAMHEPRVDAAVVVIGCPDYTRLMTQRAQKSKRKTWLQTEEEPGARFLGSEDFPHGLLEAISAYDPTGLLAQGIDLSKGPSDADKARLRPVIQRALGGKKMLCLSGGADKLVPYAQSAPFLTYFKDAIAEGGWCGDLGIELTDEVYEGVGHEMTPAMAERAVAWICSVLDVPSQKGHAKI